VYRPEEHSGTAGDVVNLAPGPLRPPWIAPPTPEDESMSIDAGRIMLEWVAVGTGAFGLVFSGHIVALVYWEGADVAERGGEPVVTDAGFSWVPADRPWQHFYLFATPNPAEGDWAQARALAARAYFEWTDKTMEHDDPARRDETDETAELRREAGEFLSRSQWWRDPLLRERLLRGEPDGPQLGRSRGTRSGRADDQ
jgi:hypothetical protein